MTVPIKYHIYKTTVSCGCPEWLSLVVILVATILLHGRLLLYFVSNSQNIIEESTAEDKYHFWLLVTCLTLVVLDLSFALLALWGIIKRGPFLLLTYISWNIILMSSVAYVIYRGNKERALHKDLYKIMVSVVMMGQHYEKDGFGILELLMCIPIVIKAFITLIFYRYYQTVVRTRLENELNRLDLKDINNKIRMQVNEAVARHLNKSNPYLINV